MMLTDRAWMRRALVLASRGGGGTSPNPMVGALVVREGRCILEGWHRVAGGPHAEVACLQGVRPGDLLACTLYVSLEPCSHQGRTPPCAELVARHGFDRVVVGMQDPNPLVAGRGIQRLRESGTSVTTGVLEHELRRLNRGFLSLVEAGRPWITLKWAQSQNGAVAEARGCRSAISGVESRQKVLQLRALHAAILIGVETALIDNPLLGLDSFSGPAPTRFVLDSRLRLPLDSRLARTAHEQPLVLVCGSEAGGDRQRSLEDAGVRVFRQMNAAKPQLPFIMDVLQRQGLNSVLVEGGPVIHRSFLDSGLVDEIVQICSGHDLPAGVPAVDLRTGEKRFGVCATEVAGSDEWRFWRPALIRDGRE